jgi:hypothetical protein
MKTRKIVPLFIALLLGTSAAFAQNPNKQPPNPNTSKVEHPKEVKKVQPQVEESQEKNLEDRRKQVLREAVGAISETHRVLKALEAKKNEEALGMLSKVMGKLELVMAREPELELLPVSVSESMVDLIADKKTLQDLLQKASQALKDGKVQETRHLLASAASEIVIRTTSIPLGSYPDTIKSIAPLIDAGDIGKARSALQSALSSLVVTEEIVPLPPLRASLLLKKAEKLAENQTRDAAESKELATLLKEARHQLEMTELLGYGSKKDMQSIYKEIDLITGKTHDKQGGKGWFDLLKKKIASLTE